MTNFSVVVYDIEIINPIRPKPSTVGYKNEHGNFVKPKTVWESTCEKWQRENPGKEIKFCDGWTDFANMGIACIGTYDYQTDQYRAFLKDNLKDFVELVKNRQYLVGYNNTTFDNYILEANNLEWQSAESWDLLRSIWSKLADLGLPKKDTGLDSISKANNLPGKSGDGMLAALNWQMGNYGKTIDYCLNDVWLTKKLIDTIENEGSIVDASGNILEIQLPWL